MFIFFSFFFYSLLIILFIYFPTLEASPETIQVSLTYQNVDKIHQKFSTNKKKHGKNYFCKFIRKTKKNNDNVKYLLLPYIMFAVFFFYYFISDCLCDLVILLCCFDGTRQKRNVFLYFFF